MPIADIAEAVLEGLPLILVAQAVVAVIVWLATSGRGDRGAQVAAWVLLVTATLWIGSLLAFILIHAVLFVAGREAALVGVVATTAFMVVMPFGWAYLVRSRGRRAGPSGA